MLIECYKVCIKLFVLYKKISFNLQLSVHYFLQLCKRENLSTIAKLINVRGVINLKGGIMIPKPMLFFLYW